MKKPILFWGLNSCPHSTLSLTSLQLSAWHCIKKCKSKEDIITKLKLFSLMREIKEMVCAKAKKYKTDWQFRSWELCCGSLLGQYEGVAKDEARDRDGSHSIDNIY